MIAKASWFSQRKFGGWGLTPNCWQGWAYILTIALLLGILGNIKLPGYWSTGLMLALGVIFSLDFIDIFVHLKKDERDTIHEAIAERNAMWFMVTILGIGIAFQASTNKIDPIILVALFGSMIVKAITHWYLKNK